VIYLALAVLGAAAAYQLVALVAALRHMLVKEPRAHAFPPVSILKPIRGLDPHFWEAIRSHAVLDYPEFEVLFGVADPDDEALPVIERLIAEFPGRQIRLIHGSTLMANAKVGVLADLARQARYPVLVMNDSDIEVPPDYLRRLVAPLENPGIGIVTCLFRGEADHWPGRFEAIGIATNFMPSALVAPLVGVNEFGLGATLAFRAETLRAIGGFEAFADYLADDYQLARHITRLGMRAFMAKVVIVTHLGDDTWGGLWQHQLRWARTIRLCRGDGYMGLPITHAGVWALAAALSGYWWLALPLVALRVFTGVLVGRGIVRSSIVLKHFYLIPLWDIWAFCLWLAGLFGKEVVWRNRRLRLNQDGRIVGH
jgi:ceramide glucosyltransferase